MKKTYSVNATFRRWNSKWTVIQRIGPILLLRQRFIYGSNIDNLEVTDCWTVCKVGRVKKEVVWPNGNITPVGSELLPGDNDYGKTAWNYCNEGLARKHFDELTRELTPVTKKKAVKKVK